MYLIHTDMLEERHPLLLSRIGRRLLEHLLSIAVSQVVAPSSLHKTRAKSEYIHVIFSQ